MTLQNWQAYVLLAWPVITALASLGYSLIDKTTRGHAALSFLAGLGLDLPKLLDAVKRLLSPPSTFVTAKGPDGEIVRFRDPRSRGFVDVRSLQALFLVSAVAIAFAAIAVACIPNPAGQVQDGLALERCIQSHWGQPFVDVVSACAANEEQAVADGIADLVAFLEKNPDAGAVSLPNPYTSEPKVLASLPSARLRISKGH